MKQVDVRKATHVKVGTTVERIISKWGIDEHGHLAPPSKGGFGVMTESGKRVDMFDAHSYWKDDG